MKTFGEYQHIRAEAVEEKSVRCRTCDTPLKAVTDEYLWFECGQVSAYAKYHLNPVGLKALPCERPELQTHRCMSDHGHHFHGMRTFVEWQKGSVNAD